jgi:hypothetical protein
MRAFYAARAGQNARAIFRHAQGRADAVSREAQKKTGATRAPVGLPLQAKR